MISTSITRCTFCGNASTNISIATWLLVWNATGAARKVKKVYGYLKKPIKAQVNAIVDELAKVPMVAEYYEQWNQSRDEAEQV